MTWRIVITPQARTMLAEIRDHRVREQIAHRIDALAEEPEKQGKALVGALAGYRSVRAVGQRYRIVYRVDEGEVIVLVVALGLRREGSKADVYELARKVLRLRLLEEPQAYAATLEGTEGD